MIQPGKKAPALDIPDQDGNMVTLKEFAGKKLVLFFYPKDSTPGCTMESCNLRDNYSALVKMGFEVIGVSADSAKRHQNFIAKNQLPYRLLADTEKKVISAYGVWGAKKMFGVPYEGILRTTFIINESGVVEHVISDVKVKDHTSQIVNLYKNK